MDIHNYIKRVICPARKSLKIPKTHSVAFLSLLIATIYHKIIYIVVKLLIFPRLQIHIKILIVVRNEHRILSELFK